MPPKGERRKQQIIDTAKAMFIEKGFQSTHIGQVCEELDIARGTVYQYFSNKKEILYALLNSVIEQIEDILDQDDLDDFLKDNSNDADVEKFITDRIIESIRVILSEPIVIKLIFKEIAGIDEEVTETVNNSIEKIRSVIAEEISKLIEMKVFSSQIDSEITASMLIGGIMLLVYEYDKKNKDILNDSVVSSIVENYLNGAFSKLS